MRGVLEEDITSLDEQLKFKMNWRQQAETERKYKLCEEITQELSMVKQVRREKARELSALLSNEQKSCLVQEMKGKQEAVKMQWVYWQIYLRWKWLPSVFTKFFKGQYRSGFVSLVSEDKEGESAADMLVTDQQNEGKQLHFPQSLPVPNQ